ncbi:hypothetical protein SteCoe_3464 [Stentor coeruleus]|uniref:SET domain-containing protein n=1 Tax=Stentor coeruleus TaxID=5963 RepID=A0A1R2CWW8_9CILI|nr:hypothetical protein SteCoe_3464 [Stentor coeruleus]
MESKIKGGGGALTRNDLSIKHDASVNTEKTQKAQADSKYLKLYNWAIANGILMPSLQFPIAYWDEGIIGIGAKVDLPTNKAFMFIPTVLVISPSVAKKSLISSIFSAYPYFFAGHDNAEFDILLVFLVYEKSKGSSSKWHTYFEAINDLELLCDWSENDLQQLQDPLLVYHAREFAEKISKKFDEIKEVFDEHSDFFPQGPSLREYFEWSYRVLSTRSVEMNELSLIPMADFINVSNNELVYEYYDADVLNSKANHPEGNIDLRDFLGSSVKGQGVLENDRWTNRLEKFLKKKQGKEAVKAIGAIWEVDRLFQELESSEDEEDIYIIDVKDEINDDDEIEEENEEDKTEIQGDDYIIISTDPYVGIKQGSQILGQTKRMSNRDWLLQYGFCFENNYYDSFYILFWTPSYGKTGFVSLQDIQEKTYQTELSAASLSLVAELICVKPHKLNLEVLKYFRKTLDYAKYNLQQPFFKASPTNIDTEIIIVDQALDLFTSLESKLSPLSHDMNLMNRNLPKRLKYALLYRISQKKIIGSQKNYLSLLKGVLIKARENGIEKHMVEKSVKNVKAMYPLMRYLKSLWVNIKKASEREGK